MNSNWSLVAPISFQLPQDRDNSVAVRRLRDAYLQDKPLKDDKATADELSKLYSDAFIGFSVHRMVTLMANHSPHKVWYGEFSYVGDHSHYMDHGTNKPIGAMHHDDLIYLFTLHYAFPTIPVTSTHSHMVDKMTAMWYNFAKYGNPNPRGDTPELTSLSWPATTPADRKYLRIDKEFSLHNNLFEDRFKVWEEVYSIQY